MRTLLGSTLLMAVVLGALFLAERRASSRPVAPEAKAPDDPARQIAELQGQIKALQGLVPDQAAIMSHVAYHFGNLWFAVDQENWELADFYLSETRSNLKWAVRAKPIRKDGAGRDIDLNLIAQAIDNAQFTDMKKVIAAKDKKAFVKLYDETLGGCYACHKTSQKPYLRPQRPTAPEARIVNFDPKATEPK